MKITVETTIEQNIEAVWDVMGNQFAEAHLWSANFKASQPGGEPKLEGVTYAHRATITDRGETIQELDAFEPQNYSLAYHITEGAPEVAEKASAVWYLKEAADDQTQAFFEFTLEPKSFVSEEMATKIKMGLLKSSQMLAEEMKYYVENGKPHPRKVASMENA